MPGISGVEFKKLDEPLTKQLRKFANLIDREWPTSVSQEGGTHIIFHSFVLAAETTYKTIIWICAELPDLEGKGRDPQFVLSVPPLARAILDQVFTVCFLSEDIKERSFWYFKAGWRELKERDDRERRRYSTDKRWEEVLRTNLELLDRLGELAKVTKDEQATPSKIKTFPNPGRMHTKCVNGSLKDYLLFLNDWFYRELSQEAHLSATGLITRAFPQVLVHTGAIPDQLLRERLEQVRSSTIVTTVTLMVALLSEIQGILKLPSISEDLSYLWTLLGAYWKDPEDLYKRRYQSLLAP